MVVAIASVVLVATLLWVLYTASFRIDDSTTWVLVAGNIALIAVGNAIPVVMRSHVPTRISVTRDQILVVTLANQEHRVDWGLRGLSLALRTDTDRGGRRSTVLIWSRPFFTPTPIDQASADFVLTTARRSGLHEKTYTVPLGMPGRTFLRLKH